MQELSLITGGAGFIGSHLTQALVRSGYPVRVFDDFSTGLRENLSSVHERIDLQEGSLVDAVAVERAMRDVGVVYHLGAMASVARSVEQPLLTHATCNTGTIHVLDAARKAGVRRVVYAGSSSAYGGVMQPGGQTEDQLPLVKSPYAAAKMAGELYMQAFAATYSIETVRVRFFNIFGPRQRSDSPYSGVIALFLAAMSRGETPTIHGDGKQSRDFTYVDNAVLALRRAAEVPDVSGRVYNVGTGRSITIRQLVQQLNHLLGTEIEPEYGPKRQGDVPFSQADIRQTQTELGYEPLVTFEEGLRKTVTWYLETSGSFRRPSFLTRI